ncbi:MAG: type II toxin-antitoxin system VapB family antitoxin [Treponema sp.]|jgi:Arc/MetJ family transcription regulator|nr:type II toxin-antitoxin system VapB family antitoxin [Treponema sp.]
MRTNVELDDVLVKKAMKITRISTKKALINKALKDFLIASYAIIADMYLLHNDTDFTQIASGSKLKIYSINRVCL